MNIVASFFLLFLTHAQEGSLYVDKVSKIQEFSDFDLQSLRGQNSLWYFFQPGCESCRRQSQEFSCLPPDLKILAVGVLGSAQAIAQEYRRHLPGAIGLYGGAVWQKKLQINKTPTLLWVDKNGTLVWRKEHMLNCSVLKSLI